jgi:hypothetical protein
MPKIPFSGVFNSCEMFAMNKVLLSLAKEAFFTGKSPVFRTVIGTIVLRAEIIVLKHVGRYGFLGRVSESSDRLAGEMCYRKREE